MSQTHQRQQQLGNFQKQLLTNYFLQKYNNLMTEMTHTNHHQATFDPKPQYKSSKKKNFKNLIMLKERNSNSNIKIQSSGVKSRQSSHQKQVESILRSDQYNSLKNSKHESNAMKNLQKLENSLIRQLFKESPTKLQKGNYDRIQISPGRSSSRNKYTPQERQEVYQGDNIEVTFQDQHEDQNSYQELWKEGNENSTIREAIKQQFYQRKNPIYFANSRNSSRQKQQSLQKSSEISMEGFPTSPKKSKRVSPFGKAQNINYQRIEINEFPPPSKKESVNSRSNSIMKESGRKQQKSVQKESQSPHVHFSSEAFTPLHIDQSKQHSREDQEIIEKQIEFMAPSSSYYKSQNNNFVEEAFQHQAQQGGLYSPTSEREQSLSYQKRQISQIMKKKKSKKSLFDKNHDKSSGKQSPPIDASFMSRLSYFSTEEGINIKTAIQKELFDNELGPYQSALYGILDLIQTYPRSGTVYTVGQRTLDDRKKVQEKKLRILQQTQNYKKKIQKLERKGIILHLGGQDEKIKRNKLEIMRLIRQLGAKLK